MSQKILVGNKFYSGSLESFIGKVKRSSLLKPFTGFRYIILESPYSRGLDCKSEHRQLYL